MRLSDVARLQAIRPVQPVGRGIVHPAFLDPVPGVDLLKRALTP